MTAPTEISEKPPLSTKKYFFAMIAISFLLLQLFILIVYQQSRASQVSGDRLIHSYEVLRLGRLSVIDAIDLANDEQYYLLTGSPAYLEALEKTRHRLDGQIDTLATYNMNNEEYRDNIVTLRQRVENLESIQAAHLDAIRKKRIDAYSMNAFLQATRQAATDMRAAYDALTENESEIIKARRAKAIAEHQRYIWTLGIGTAMGLGLLLIGNVLVASLMARNARAKEKIVEGEKLFELILNGLNDGIFDYNLASGKIIYSPSYQKMLGYTAQELGEKQDYFYKYVHPDDLAPAIELCRQFIEEENA